MPRIARLVLPGIPHHVTQRGNRSADLFRPGRLSALQQSLAAGRRGEDGGLGVVPMPNHVHIIVVPEDETGLRRLFGPVHRQYTWRVNQREDWRGCLWQGRYGSVAMDEAHASRLPALRRAQPGPGRPGRAAGGVAMVKRSRSPRSRRRRHRSRRCGGRRWRPGLGLADRDAIRAADGPADPLGRPARRALGSGEQVPVPSPAATVPVPVPRKGAGA